MRRPKTKKLHLKKPQECRWCGSAMTYVKQCICPGNPELHGRCPKCYALVWLDEEDVEWGKLKAK